MAGKSGRKQTKGAKSPPVGVLHDRIVARICRLADAMLLMSSQHIKRLWDLRNTDLRLLSVLHKEALPVIEISRRTLLDQAWVSRSVRTLEAKKLVDRHSDPRDSRITRVALTKAGHQILIESRPYAVWSEQVLLKGIDDRQLKALLDQLETNTKDLMHALESRSFKPGSKARLDAEDES